MHKFSAAQIVATLRFSCEFKPFARKRAALTSLWGVNMLRAARKGSAIRPGFFEDAISKTGPICEQAVSAIVQFARDHRRDGESDERRR
jgi:hypothetical protein